MNKKDDYAFNPQVEFIPKIEADKLWNKAMWHARRAGGSEGGPKSHYKVAQKLMDESIKFQEWAPKYKRD